MIERWEIDELVTRYALESELQDVFVEGPGDKALIEWIARKLGIDGLIAYEIGSVNVPDPSVLAVGQDIGNRGRVVALSLELEGASEIDLYHTVGCFIDADLDHCLGRVPDCRLLMVTDYSAIEIYLLHQRPLAKFFELVAQRADLVSSTIIGHILPLLNELFFVRLAAHDLEVRLPQIDFRRVAEVSGKSFTFDAAEFAGRFIRRDKYSKLESEFLDRVEQYRASHSLSQIHFAHGHDFVEVLHWYLSKVVRISGLPDPHFLGKSLRGCLELDDLADTNLVAELEARFGGERSFGDAA